SPSARVARLRRATANRPRRLRLRSWPPLPNPIQLEITEKPMDTNRRFGMNGIEDIDCSERLCLCCGATFSRACPSELDEVQELDEGAKANDENEGDVEVCLSCGACAVVEDVDGRLDPSFVEARNELARGADDEDDEDGPPSQLAA